MKLLVIGSGGREHALAWKLAQSPRVEEVIVAPGNAGTAHEDKCRNADVKATDIDGLLALAEREGVALTVVGPEQPLVAGVVDAFRAKGHRIFGPTAAAAQLEGSKAYAKDFLARHGIPTAFYAVHTEVDAALAYIHQKGAPIVVKADGLAAGKGVIVATTLDEAEAAVRDMLEGNAFGDAGARVVIEEFLDGEEASFISMVDGSTALPMATSQDHKRVGDGDTGPNTGGMGAYSPARVLTPDLRAQVIQRIVAPTVKTLAEEGTPYSGVLYAGLMLTAEGPKLVEYNCRFGDPECQVLMMRLESDLGEYLLACADCSLGSLRPPKFSDDRALTVVMAANGYPGTPEKGGAIDGIADAEAGGAKVFHAGTALADGRLVANGGRVLNVTARGRSVAEAQAAAYAAVDALDFPSGFCRRDIGWREIERERRG
jgi:phosphoribosylamine--glycine ligase